MGRGENCADLCKETRTFSIGSFADSEEAVRATLENRFSVVFLDVVGKLFVDQARSDRHDIIDQSRRLSLRIECHQKVDVISLVIKFD